MNELLTKLEDISVNAWPAIESSEYDGWLLGFSHGYTDRANSVIPLKPSTLPIDEKIAFCENYYQSKGMGTTFKLTPETSEIEQALLKRGYLACKDTAVRLLELDNFDCKDTNLKFDYEITDEWIKDYTVISKLNESEKTISEKIYKKISGNIIAATKRLDGKTIAVGFSIIEDGYAGMFSIAVDDDYRRRGIGYELMCGLMSEAKHRGAHTAYLQVMLSKIPAMGLYDKIGFKEIYRYHYLKK